MNDDKTIFSNEFGKVTDKQVIVNYKDGLEYLPVNYISSISLKHERSYVFGIGGLLIFVLGLIVALQNYNPYGGNTQIIFLIITAIVGLLSGIANLIGHHNIMISAAGQDRKPLKVEMSKTKQGREFVDAIKTVLIK